MTTPTPNTEIDVNDLNTELVYPANTQTNLGKRIVRQLTNRQDRLDLETVINFSEDLGGKTAYENLYRSAASNVAQGFSSELNPVRSKITLTVNSDLYSPSVDYTFTINPGSFSTTTGDITFQNKSANNKIVDVVLSTSDIEKYANLTVCANVYVDGHSVGQKCVDLTLFARALNTALVVTAQPSTSVVAEGSAAQTAAVTLVATSNNTIPNRSYEFQLTKLSGGPDALITNINANTIKISTFNDVPDGNANLASYRVKTLLKGGNTPQTVEVLADNTQTITVSSIYSGVGITSLAVQGGNFQNNQFTNSGTSTAALTIVGQHNATSPACFIDYEFVTRATNTEDVTYTTNVAVSSTATSNTHRIILTHNPDLGSPFVMRESVTDVIARLKIVGTNQVIGTRTLTGLTLRTGAYGLDFVPVASNSQIGFDAQTASSFTTASWQAGYFEWNVIPISGGSLTQSTIQADNTTKIGNVTLQVWANTPGNITQSAHTVRPLMWFSSSKTTQIPLTGAASTGSRVDLFTQYRIPDFAFTTIVGGTTFTGNTTIPSTVANNTFSNSYPVSSRIRLQSIHNLPFGYVDYEPILTQGDAATVTIFSNTVSGTGGQAQTDIILNQTGDYGFKKSIYSVVATLRDNTARQVLQRQIDGIILRTGAYGLTYTAAPSVTKSSAKLPVVAESLGVATFYAGDFNFNTVLGVPDVIYSFYDNIVGTPKSKEVTLRIQTTAGTLTRQIGFTPRLTFPGEPTVVVTAPAASTTTLTASVLSYSFTLTAAGGIISNNVFQNAAPVSAALSFTATHNLAGGYLQLYAEKVDGDDASFSIGNTATQVTTKSGTLTLSVPSGFALKRAKYKIVANLFDSTDLEVPVATRDIIQAYNDLATLRTGAYGLTFNTTSESNTQIGFTAQTAILAGAATFALPPGDGGSQPPYWSPTQPIYSTGFPTLTFDAFGSQLNYQLRADSQPAKDRPTNNINAASYSIGPVLQFDGITVVSPKKTISVNATCNAYTLTLTTPSFSNIQVSTTGSIIASMTTTAAVSGVSSPRIAWNLGFNPVGFTNTALTINTFVTAPALGGSNTVQVSGIEAILRDSTGLIELDRKLVQPYTLDAANPMLQITGISPQTITGKGIPQATSEIYAVSTMVGTPQMNFPTLQSGSTLRVTPGPAPASYIIEAYNESVGTTLSGTYGLTGIILYNGQQRQVTRSVTVSATVEMSSLDVTNNQTNKVVSNFSSTPLEANIVFNAVSDLAGGLITASVSSLQGAATSEIIGSPGPTPQVSIKLPQSLVGQVNSTYNVTFALADSFGRAIRNVSANNNTYGNVICTILNPNFTLTGGQPTTPTWTFTSGTQGSSKRTPNPVSVNVSISQTFTAASATALNGEVYSFSKTTTGSEPTINQSAAQYILTGLSRWVNTTLANSHSTPTQGTKTLFNSQGTVTGTLLLNGQALIGATPITQNYLVNIGMPPGQIFDIQLYSSGVRKYSNATPEGTSTLVSTTYVPAYSYGSIRSGITNYQVKWMGFHNSGNRYAFNATGGTFGLTSATGGAALNGSNGVKWYSSSSHYTEAGSPAGSYQIIPAGCFVLMTFVPSNTLGYNTLPLAADKVFAVGTDNKVYKLPAPLAYGWNNDNTSTTADDFAWAIYPCTTAVAGIAQLVFIDDSLFPTTGYAPGYIQTGLALSLQGATLPTALISSPYSYTITPVGGTPPYTWTYSGGSLSTIGLSGFGSSADYIVSGTPTAPGTVSFSLTVRDSVGASASASYSVTAGAVLEVGGPPENYAVTYGRSLYTGQVGSAYSFIGSLGDIYDQLYAKIRGTAEKTFTVQLLSGTVPPGMAWSVTNYALSSTVITSRTDFVGHDVALYNLTGTPTIAGNYTMNMRFSDGSQSVDKVYTITIVPFGTYPPGSGSGIGCPDPSAVIVMADGVFKKAGDIVVGDYVYTKHPETMEFGNYKVTMAERDIQPRVKIKFSNGKTFICSDSHVFMVTEEYSLDGGMWIKASDLREGTALSEELYVKSIKNIGMGEVVKLEVEGAHTYIVDGIPSHNISGSVDQKN